MNILKEENRIKEAQQGATSPRATDEDDEEDDSDDDDEDDADTAVACSGAAGGDKPPGSPLQEEMETIQEVEEGGSAVGGQGSTKTSPCVSAPFPFRPRGGSHAQVESQDVLQCSRKHNGTFWNSDHI